jgi:purine-binding chemotaxis protein CheW
VSVLSEEKQFVAFTLGEEEYAVDILSVQEIIRLADITRVPKAPSFVRGVSNLRGNIIPIIDSHLRLNLPADESAKGIIIFRFEDAPIGMTVDNVTEVLSLNQENIETPEIMNNIDKHFIKGIGKIDERLLIILDLKNVLDIGINLKKESGLA